MTTQTLWWRAMHGPSGWPRRLAVVLLAFAGLLVSMNLAFYQYGLTTTVWDPLFGSGSHTVLFSAFSRALPVHDAALGAVAYLVEGGLELAAGTARWRRHPWLVVLLGLTTAAMALTALGLLALQVFIVGHFCTLCLVSAGISLSVPLLAGDEVIAALRQIRRGRRIGLTRTQTLRGRIPTRTPTGH